MKYVIKGPNVAKGEVRVAGAKNFAIKALAAGLLVRGKVEYRNLPMHGDVQNTVNMLKMLGAQVEIDAVNKSGKIDAIEIADVLSGARYANMIMFLFGAAMLHRYKKVRFPKNNGCPLGVRGYDFHVMAFESFGAKYESGADYHAFSRDGSLVGCNINLPYPSVGATETCIFLAVLAKGVTRISNAAIEPEIQALISSLIMLGAHIFFENDRTIAIHGVDKLHEGIIEISGDLLEAATWAVMAAATGGEIIVSGFIPELIGSFLGMYTLIGGGVKRLDTNSVLFFKTEPKVKAILFETGVFPALRTDLQPLLAALAASQEETIALSLHETVYDTRVNCVDTFIKFGVKAAGFVNCFGSECRFNCKSLHSAVIHGGAKLIAPNESVQVTSIRNGMADLILACVAKGTTRLEGIELIERGYCGLFEKLKRLGLDITQND